MDGKSESVRQARESFDRVLRSQAYTEIIRDDRQKEILLDMLDGGVYNRILDIGTGTGYLAFALAKAYPHALVCGIDIAQGIMEENRIRARNGGFSNLVFQTFDGLAYPFEDGTFDLIVSRYAFHHFPDPGNAVRQMHGLLRPGGRVLLSDPVRAAQDRDGIMDRFMRIKQDGHIRFYAREELETLFTAAGFSVGERRATYMSFPFAPRKEYELLYDTLTDRDRGCYGIRSKRHSPLILLNRECAAAHGGQGIMSKRHSPLTLLNRECVVADNIMTIWVEKMEVGNTIFIKI